MAGKIEIGHGQRTNRWRIAIWGGAALLLLLPLVAMQFVDEVKWTLFDFLFAGTLIFGPLFAFELALRMTRNVAYRAALGVALAAAILLAWINGAVGIIGDSANDANMMYVGVLAIGVAGALIARFRAGGMARALLATTIAQIAIAVIVLVATLRSAGSPLPWDALILTGFFAALFAGSAWLFSKAAKAELEQSAA